MLQDKRDYNFDGVGDEIANAFDEGYKQGIKEFAEFIISQMGMERDYMGIKYRQGVFSNLDIDAFVAEFDKENENE